MTRAVCWKEWREQRFFGALLVTAGVALLYVAGELSDGGLGSQNAILAQHIALFLLAVTVGVVSGAMLLAGERENNTQWFLDLLPTTRFRVWRAKFAFGLVFSLSQSLILVGAGWALGGFPDHPLGWAAVMAFSTAVGFVGGVCGSAVSQTVLGAAGFGLALVTLCWFAAYLMAIPFIESNAAIVWAALGITFTAIPLAWSIWVYTRPDRGRRAAAEFWEGARSPTRVGVLPLFWLVYRQSRGLLFGIAVVSAALGVMLLGAQSYTVFAWMGASGLIGLLWGVTVFADEHANGCPRFWGERRLPVGRLWAVKVFAHGLFLAACLVVLAVPLMGRAFIDGVEQINNLRRMTGFAEAFRSVMLDHLGSDAVAFLWVAPWTAFAVGLLVGLVFQKTLVAAVVALLSAAPLVAVWVPSLIAGGVHGWQLLVPPLVILITSRLLMHRWASDRLSSSRGVVIGAGGVTLALLCIVGGLVVRATELPDVPDALAESGYAERLPTIDANSGGRELKQTYETFTRIGQEVRSSVGDVREFHEVMTEVIQRGWEGDESADAAAWMSAYLAQQEWQASMNESLKLSPGVVDDPRLTTSFTADRTADATRMIALVMAVRGLKQQAEGEPAEFADQLERGLAVLDRSRHLAPFTTQRVVASTQGIWADATMRWLEQLRGHPELIQRVLKSWREYIASPSYWADAQWADMMIARTTMDQPQTWLTPRMMSSSPTADPKEPLASMVAFAWNFPWERRRKERQIRLTSQGTRYAESPWLWPLQSIPRRGNREEEQKRAAAQSAGIVSVVALRLYQLENGKPAANLGELVPKYLESVPIDPFDGQPMRYRVSDGTDCVYTDLLPLGTAGDVEGPGVAAGGSGFGPGEPTPEVMDMPPHPGRVIVPLKAGQGVVWSVGPDGIDSGGRRQSLSGNQVTSNDQDLIWVVPVERP